MNHGAPAKAVWLHLLRSGRFQGTGEIRAALPDVHFPNLSATLHAMCRTGSLDRREGVRWPEYGVSLSCAVTPGCTAEEIAEALADRPTPAQLMPARSVFDYAQRATISN